jgi:hypothetical protein
MLKKYLATVLATFTMLSRFSTLFIVSALLVSNPILTSSARAETIDYSRGIQFLSSHRDVLDKIIAQVWRQGGWKIVTKEINDELLTGGHVNTYFPPDIIYGSVVTLGQPESNASMKSYTDGSAARVDFTIKNNTIRFKVRNQNTNTNPFSRSVLPVEVIVKCDLNISLKIKANRRILLGSDLYVIPPFSSFSVNILNSTNPETTRKIKNSLFGDISSVSFFKYAKYRFNSDASAKDYLTTKIQSAIEQNIPAEQLKPTMRKSHSYRGQEASIDPIEDPDNPRPYN